MAKKGWFSWFGKGKQTEDKEETSVAGEISDKTNTDAVSTAEKQDDVLQSNNAESLSKDKIEADKLSEGAEKEPAVEELSQPEEVLPVPQEKPGFFKRLVNGLRKTRENLGLGIKALFKGRKIDDDLFEELESTLISADIGIETTEKLIEKLTAEASLKELKDADSLVSRLNADLHEILKKVSVPLVIDTSKKPFVILMVGVNGVGKTTTIGKMAKFFEAQGHKVMLAAGDTFRAAAVEQLKVWGQRNGIPVVAQSTGADSASVIFDALSSAKAKGYDILIADTAGRLQNKANLMAELQKIVRVMQKIDPEAPHEVMLTVDAGTGQNAISQVKLFGEVVPITGINITKLDGTAKGGVIFNIADNFGIPIRFIGVGEGIDDLRVFDADDFVKALFDEE
ncbi:MULTISPECIES: signal recognition particle-docking protein FtsY [Ruminobacter]|jgi:fused signal recognition particle receptor|uniref:Signal recognition particle receptor FtsY n=1 Tax=Ruminobacter amylophilus TaxID=867 RepID=A0A662ZK90_9GAMM|nr:MULTISPECIES: signal recognition particle-docking protein FtsY [Ruminobacter]SFP77934.1 fused signal recognition particle receptor [Ruminobacter amylophilus]